MIHNLIFQVEESVIAPTNMSFVDFQTNIFKLARQIAQTSHDMVAKSGTDASELGGLAGIITRDFGHLSHETTGAVATSPHTQVPLCLY